MRPANAKTAVTTALVSLSLLCAMAVAAAGDHRGTRAGIDEQALAGVPVGVGESVQKAVDGHPAGTVFVIKAGVHVRQSVRPKPGNQFLGEPGAVMDGQGATTYAFYGNAADVVIRGLEIKNYTNPAQHGAIHAQVGPHDNPPASDLSTGWILENLDVHHNPGAGILIATRTQLRNSRVHHNGQLGLTARGGAGAVIDNVEVDHNNTDGWDADWEAGGSKFKYTTNLTVRNSHFHDNAGYGLWTDIDNVGTLYEHNVIEDEARTGIFHEISGSAIIRHNIIRRVAIPFSQPWNWGFAAGISVAASHDVQIYGNLIEDSGGGITAVQQDRGSSERLGPRVLDRVHVHDNTIRRSGESGVFQDTGNLSVFDRDLRWSANTYDATWGRYGLFAWRDTWHNFTEWQRQGQDLDGTYQ